MIIQFNNKSAYAGEVCKISTRRHSGNEKYSNHCQLSLIKPLNIHNVITERREVIFDDWLFIIIILQVFVGVSACCCD